MSDSANRAGRAFCLAADSGPELAELIRSAGKALAQAVEVNAADMTEAAGQLEAWGFTRPDELEDWRRVALAGGVPFEVVRAGDFTARDAMDAAGGLVDRATVEGKHNGRQHAAAAKPKGKRCPRGKGEEWVHLALLAVHKWDSDESAADGGLRGLVGCWTPATLAELAAESGTSEGTVSKYMDKLFGSGGDKGDGMDRYKALCNRKDRELAAVLRRIDGGGPDRFSGGGDALDHLDEEGMAGARRGRTGQRILANKGGASYGHTDLDDE